MEIVEKKDEELQKSRHSLAHVLAKALVSLYPNTKLAIGPAIEDGFYYDIELDKSITANDFQDIEKKMKEIINKGEKFEKKVVTKEEALKLFKDNVYKTEIINELKDGAEVSIYYLGEDFFDLCRGPHVESCTKLQNFGYKIHSINGAYWRGNEKNKMLQRVYVYAFKTKKELAEYIAKLILDEGRSPAKIINMLQENPKYAVVPKSSATIYNAIDNGLIPGVTRENLNSDITTVFNDGQIHIAKWVRNALKIKDGDKLSFEVVNNKIIFSKANEQS